MIRYNSQRQLTLEGFETPFEMNLDPPNRWVKYANELPWDDVAEKFISNAMDYLVEMGVANVSEIYEWLRQGALSEMKENSL